MVTFSLKGIDLLKHVLKTSIGRRSRASWIGLGRVVLSHDWLTRPLSVSVSQVRGAASLSS